MSPSERPVILVMDDEVTVAKAVQATLVAAGYDVPQVVTEARRFDAALAAHEPTLVLLDIDLGDNTSGIDLAAKVPASCSILFVSAHADRPTLELAGRRNPAGFVVKPFTATQLIAAVEIALAARRPSPANVMRALPTSGPLGLLSDREREVLELLLAHKRAPAIAKTLFISQHTVRNHLKRIYAKLEVGSQQELLNFVTVQLLTEAAQG